MQQTDSLSAPTLDFVINPNAGTIISLGRARVEKIIRDELGDRVGTIHFVPGADIKSHVAQWHAGHTQRPGHALVVGGGDGTIRSVAEEFMAHNAPMGVLPLGFLNLFARSIGMPSDFRRAVTALKDARETRVDILRVNERVALANIALDRPTQLGLQAREDMRGLGREKLSRRLEKLRAGLGNAFRSASLAMRKPSEATLRLKGAVQTLRGRFLLIVNNRLLDAPGAREADGHEACLSRRALGFLRMEKPDQGTITTYEMGRGHQGTALLGVGAMLSASLFGGQWQDHASTRHTTGSDPISIETITCATGRTFRQGDNISLMVDAETETLRLPITVTIHRRALPVLSPLSDT